MQNETKLALRRIISKIGSHVMGIRSEKDIFVWLGSQDNTDPFWNLMSEFDQKGLVYHHKVIWTGCEGNSESGYRRSFFKKDVTKCSGEEVPQSSAKDKAWVSE